jgi:hypothetical protein
VFEIVAKDGVATVLGSEREKVMPSGDNVTVVNERKVLSGNL